MAEKSVFDRHVGDPTDRKNSPQHIVDVLEGHELPSDSYESTYRKGYRKQLEKTGNRRGFADLSLDEVVAARDRIQDAFSEHDALHASGPVSIDVSIDDTLRNSAARKVLDKALNQQLPEPADFRSLPAKERKRFMQRRTELRAMLLEDDATFDTTTEMWREYEQLHLRKEMRGFRAGPMMREQLGLMNEADRKHKGVLGRLHDFETGHHFKIDVVQLIDDVVEHGYDDMISKKGTMPRYKQYVDELKKNMSDKDARNHLTELLTHRYLSHMNIDGGLRAQLRGEGMHPADIDSEVERVMNDLAYLLRNPEARTDYDVYRRRDEVVQRHQRIRDNAIKHLVRGNSHDVDRAQEPRPDIADEKDSGVRLWRRMGRSNDFIRLYESTIRGGGQEIVPNVEFLSRFKDRISEAYHVSGGQTRLLRAGLIATTAFRSLGDISGQFQARQEKLRTSLKEKVDVAKNSEKAYKWVNQRAKAGKAALKNTFTRNKGKGGGTSGGTP